MAFRLKYTGQEIEELLDIVKQGGNKVEIEIDDSLSSTSTNPVQNKVITEALSENSQTANSAIDTANAAKELAYKLEEKIENSSLTWIDVQ